jgi:protein-glucosylgalactosylhydroxylysine glucosidase
VLGPALIPAQERFEPETTINPVFELAYWHWGLKTAQNIRTTLGHKPDKKWQQVIEHLSLLPVSNNLYLFTENATDTYTNPQYLTDHPIVFGITGFLPVSDYVDQKILENTINTIDTVWNWETCWGWDFPLAAMNATLLNNPQKAIYYLLMETPKNNYLLNGHNYQHSDLPLYLPGNGGLLAAAAMMCNQNDFNNKFSELPGWKIKYEGFAF